jgi:hypothetical protein
MGISLVSCRGLRAPAHSPAYHVDVFAPKLVSTASGRQASSTKPCGCCGLIWIGCLPQARRSSSGLCPQVPGRSGHFGAQLRGRVPRPVGVAQHLPGEDDGVRLAVSKLRTRSDMPRRVENGLVQRSPGSRAVPLYAPNSCRTRPWFGLTEKTAL